MNSNSQFDFKSKISQSVDNATARLFVLCCEYGTVRVTVIVLNCKEDCYDQVLNFQCQNGRFKNYDFSQIRENQPK